MSVAPIIAAVAAAQRRIIEYFRAAGAVSPATAVGRPESRHERMLDQLVRRGVIVEVSPGRYYLDEAELARRNSMKAPAVAIVVIVLFIAMLVAILIASR